MNNLFKNVFEDKRVLITGHTGFKGSWLSLWLQKLGAKLVGYALEPPTAPSLFELADVSESMTSITGDVQDYENLFSVLNEHKPEIIVHMAAQSLVRESYRNPITTYSTNVMGTVNLLEAVRHSSSAKVVVNVTSDKCYENNEWVWAYRENDRLGGHDPYSNSKACSELVTSAFRDSFFPKDKYTQHGVALASARAGNVIGGGDWAEDRLVPDCIRSFLKQEKVKIRNPKSVRPWQHVLDPLRGYLLLAEMLYEHGPAYSGAWNFGPKQADQKSVRYIVNYTAKRWGRKAQWESDEKPHARESNALKLDCAKAKSWLGWRACWDLDTSLDKTIEWYRIYKENPKKVRDTTMEHISKYEKCLLNQVQNAD